ncbi:MAG: hypothetical protein IJW41_01840 [Oscillospiraceae bacterium]|nr:hypothetical protein [Oscillospiraceae bacterium]
MVEMKLAEQAPIPMELGSEILRVEVGYDRFWDAYQENGNRTNYESAFQGDGWTDETFAPKYDIAPQDAMGGIRMFYKTRITDIQKILEDRGLTLDTSKVALMQTFQRSQILRVGTIDMRKCAYSGYADSAFADSTIETIDKLSVIASVQFSNNTFKSCANLKNLTIEGVIGKSGFDVRWSVNLSKASIISIIGALSATTSGLTVTLSATAVTNAFGSTSADQWTALVATKPNWTISLV